MMTLKLPGVAFTNNLLEVAVMSADFYEKSLLLHEHLRGKIEVANKAPIETQDDLSVSYTPGVARPCEVIAADVEKARELTIKHNSVAIVSDGSAVLGLGNIGAYATIPVLEGKAMLFKQFAGIDAWPLCLDTQDTAELIRTIRCIAPVFGGINLEDISAPRCFEIESRLQDLGIPVFHDDQHGTAIVLLAALINACKVTGRSLLHARVVINGAGAAGSAIAQLLSCTNAGGNRCVAVKDVIVCDSKGVIGPARSDLNEKKRMLLAHSNREGRDGNLRDALAGADVFIGVSRGGLLSAGDVKLMAPQAVVFAMANPTPEIMPDQALAGGAAVVGTGRSDFPNQVNNVLAFPGIFRGALDAGAKIINEEMKYAAVEALADMVTAPSVGKVIPDPLDKSVAHLVAKAVAAAARRTGAAQAGARGSEQGA